MLVARDACAIYMGGSGLTDGEEDRDLSTTVISKTLDEIVYVSYGILVTANVSDIITDIEICLGKLREMYV